MTWDELAAETLAAARKLNDDGHARSSISRSYFAAYAKFTAVFVGHGGFQFTHGGHNPSHDQLHVLIRNNLPAQRSGKRDRRRLAKLFSGLQKARIDADYAPERTVTSGDSMDALRDVSVAFRLLEDE